MDLAEQLNFCTFIFDICEGTETLIYLCVLPIKAGKYWNRLPRSAVECPSFKWSLPEQPDLIRAAFSSVQTKELQRSLLMQIFCNFGSSKA